jgi:hypothetical protein
MSLRALRLRLLFLIVLACAFTLAGCATTTPAATSLTEVRRFADNAASLEAYPELARRYRDTYERERPYLSPAAEKLARATDVRRRAVYADFVNVQKTVVRYMQTLSLLAGDARYDLAPRLDEVDTSLKAGTESGLGPRHATAYIGLTRLLARVVASNYQQRSVGALVREGDADLQTLLDGMITLTRLYAKTSDNEKKTVLGLLDVEIASAPRGTDRLLLVLAKVHLQDKTAEYKLIDKRYDLATEGLSKVAQGHKKLRENLDHLDSADTRAMLAGYASDLALIYGGLRE